VFRTQSSVLVIRCRRNVVPTVMNYKLSLRTNYHLTLEGNNSSVLTKFILAELSDLSCEQVAKSSVIDFCQPLQDDHPPTFLL